MLEKARDRVEQAEVYHLQRKELPVNFAPDGLSVIKTKQIEGVALRAICEGKLGYATSTDLAHSDAIIDAAAATAVYGDSTEMTFPADAFAPLDGVFDTGTTALTAEQLVDTGEAIRQRILAESNDLEVGVLAKTTVEYVRVANTNGLDVEQERSMISFGIEAIRAQSGDIFTVDENIVLRSLDELTIDDATKRIRRLLELGRDVVPSPSGSLPVVFTPAGSLALLLPLIMGLSGKSVLLKLSPLAEKLGQDLFDPRFSLTDDGRCVAGASAGAFDDEGVPTRRTPLIENGQLRGFYYDLRTAQQAGVQSTGNGYKGGLIGGSNFRPAPSSSISSLLVGTGQSSEADLIGDIKNGLLVDGVLGLGQGNLNAGDFSNNVAAAFVIRDGKVAGRVKNVMLAGNSYDLLRNHLIGLGDKADWVYGKVSCPAIAIDNVNVTAK